MKSSFYGLVPRPHFIWLHEGKARKKRLPGSRAALSRLPNYLICESIVRGVGESERAEDLRVLLASKHKLMGGTWEGREKGGEKLASIPGF